MLVKGNGNFNAWSRMTGGLSGHWRIENTGNNDLRNAAAFAGGLSLAPNTHALVRIRDPRRYVSMDFHASDGNGDRQRMFRENYVYGWFGGKMHDALVWDLRMNQTVIGFSGFFEVMDPGVYTFAMTYDNSIWFWIDGELIAHSPRWNTVGSKSVTLSKGVHTFRIAAFNGDQGAGPNIPAWISAGISIGYCRASVSGTPAPNTLIPFDTDSPDFRMWPSATVWHSRIANTGYA